MRVAELYVLLGIEDKELQKGLRDATRRVEDFGDVAKSAGRDLSAGLTTQLSSFGKSSLDAAVRMDSLKRGLVAVAGGSAQAETQLTRLREVAKLPGLSFQDAVQGSINLQAAGFSAQLAERSLKAFGNALATVGKGAADLGGVNLALSQIASKGKISAEEINQLAERVPQIRKVMQAAFGTADSEALQKAGIGATEFVEKITHELEKLPQVTGGIANDLENASQAMQDSLAAVGTAAIPIASQFLDTLVPALTSVTDAFKSMPAFMQEGVIKAGILAAAVGPTATAVGILSQGWANLMAIRTGISAFFTSSVDGTVSLAAGVGRVTTSVATLKTALLSVPSAGTAAFAGLAAGIAGYGIGTALDSWIRDGLIGVADAQKQAEDATNAFKKQREEIAAARPVFAEYLTAKERLVKLDALIASGQVTMTVARQDYMKSLSDEIDLLRKRSHEEANKQNASGANTNADRIKFIADSKAATQEAIDGIEAQKKAQYLMNHQTAVGAVMAERLHGSLKTATAESVRTLLAQAANTDVKQKGIEATNKSIAEMRREGEERQRQAEQAKKQREQEIKGINDRLRAIHDSANEHIRLLQMQAVKSTSAQLADQLKNTELIKGNSALKKAALEAVKYAEAMDIKAAADEKATQRQEALRKSVWSVYTATRIARAEAAAALKGETLTEAQKMGIRREDPTSDEYKMSPAEFRTQQEARIAQDAAEDLAKTNKKTYEDGKTLRGKLESELNSLKSKIADLASENKKQSYEEIVQAKMKTDAWKGLTEEEKKNWLEQAKRTDQAVTNVAKTDLLSKATSRYNDLLTEQKARLTDIANGSKRAMYEAKLRGDKAIKGLDPGEYEDRIQSLLTAFDNSERGEMVGSADRRFGNMLADFKIRTMEMRDQLRNIGLSSAESRLKAQIANDPDLNNLELIDPEVYKRKVAEVVREFKSSQGLEQLVNIAQSVSERMADSITGALDTLYTDGFGGFFKSVIQGFASMIKDITMQLIRAQIVKSLTGAIGGALAGAATAGVGGSGGSGGVGSGAAGGYGGDTTAGLGNDFRANGGPVTAGRSYIVGEREPELFVPRRNGYIYNQRQLAGMGGQTIIQMTVNTPDVGSFRRSQGQLMDDAYRQSEYVRKRNG